MNPLEIYWLALYPGPISGALKGVSGKAARKIGEILGDVIFGAEEKLRSVFLRTIVKLSAKLMLADGTVSIEERNRFKRVLDDDRLDAEKRAKFEQLIDESLASPEGMEEIAKDFYDKCPNHRAWHVEMLNILLGVACSDGQFDREEEVLIRQVANAFCLTEKEYLSLKEQFAVTESDLQRYYELLGCQKTNPDEVVEQKFQELLQEHHPDKLTAAGVAEKYVKEAAEDFQQVEKAHSIIMGLRQMAGDASEQLAAAATRESSDLQRPWPTFRGDLQRTGLFQAKGIEGPNEVIWKFKTGGLINAAPVITPDYVIFGSQDHFVYCVDRQTGDELWRFRTEGEGLGTAIAYQGVVHFGCGAGSVHAVEIDTGIERWRFDSGGPVVGSPAIWEERIYFGSGDAFFYSLDVQTGELSWKFKAEKALQSSPAILDGVIYFGSDDGQLFAVNIRGGQEKWRFQSKQGRIFASPIRNSPLVREGVVYFGNNDKQFYALNAKLGHPIWTFESDTKLRTCPAISGNILLVGTSHLEALDILTGEKIWCYTGEETTASPSIAGETVYWGTSKGLQALDIRMGRRKWSFPTPSSVISSPFIDDGIIYFGSYDGFVYALS